MADLSELERRLAYTFVNADLLRRALRHASAATDDRPSNERLEFLGDAVAGLACSEYLFREFPDASEGWMTVVKSSVVSRRTMSAVARRLGLAEFMEVGGGLEEGDELPASVVGCAYEAVVAAVYMDAGADAAAELVLRTLGPELDGVVERGHAVNYKSMLQERVQQQGMGLPVYKILDTAGPDHERRFLAQVVVAGQARGQGWGHSKKAAERRAARDAIEAICPELLGEATADGDDASAADGERTDG